MQTLSPADKDYWKHIVASGNQLGLKLLPGFQGPGRGGNVVISPTSIFVILCLLYNGACGNTYVELATALGLPPDKALNPWMRQLINYINSHDPEDLDVRLASAVFCASGEPLHIDFANILAESYSASLYSIDFSLPDAADRVNAWVANATRGNISKLVTQFVPPRRLVVANAIHFLGKWADPFNASSTTMDDFYQPDGVARKTAMMTKTADLHYYEDSDCQSVLLPYQSSNYALQIVLPRTMQSPLKLLPVIEIFARSASAAPPTSIRLELPKFKLDFALSLQRALGGIGINDLSNPATCDFGRIGDKIAVDSIIHKALINVDEIGTESKAVAMAKLNAGINSRSGQSISMKVDHPFLFSVCDTVTGQILLLGTIAVP